MIVLHCLYRRAVLELRNNVTFLCISGDYNTQVRLNYFDCNMIRKKNLTFFRRVSKDFFAADVDRSKCLHATSQTRSFARTTLVTRFITNFHTVTFPTYV